MKTLKTALTFALTLALLATSTLPARAQNQATDAIDTKAKQAIVVDYNTGQILFAKNADKQMPTSSMSKTMTVYAMFEALKDGELSLTDTLPVSEKAWKKGGSKMFVEVGKRVKVEDLIRGIVIQSGNDATIVVAEGLAGSEDNFAEAITDKAREIGMKDTNFRNASGWPDPDHYSTARDLATLATSMIQEFPEYYHYFSEKEFSYNNINQRNRNPLIYRDIGADGLKTGHTESGGYGVIGSGTHKDRRVIVVVNGLQSEKERAQESAKLLEWGLRRFELKTLFNKDTPLAEAAVIFGKEKTVSAVLGEDFKATVLKLATEETTAKVVLTEPLTAPVKAGQQIGQLIVQIPHQDALTAPLYAQSAVAEKNIIAKTFEKIPYIFKGKKQEEGINNDQ